MMRGLQRQRTRARERRMRAGWVRWGFRAPFLTRPSTWPLCAAILGSEAVEQRRKLVGIVAGVPGCQRHVLRSAMMASFPRGRSEWRRITQARTTAHGLRAQRLVVRCTSRPPHQTPAPPPASPRQRTTRHRRVVPAGDSHARAPWPGHHRRDPQYGPDTERFIRGADKRLVQREGGWGDWPPTSSSTWRLWSVLRRGGCEGARRSPIGAQGGTGDRRGRRGAQA